MYSENGIVAKVPGAMFPNPSPIKMTRARKLEMGGRIATPQVVIWSVVIRSAVGDTISFCILRKSLTDGV